VNLATKIRHTITLARILWDSIVSPKCDPIAIGSSELDDESENAAADPMTSVDEPSLAQVTAAIHKLKNGRFSGPGVVPAELLKSAILPVSLAKALYLPIHLEERPHTIQLARWHHRHCVQGERKGLMTDCSSYRPITLLSVPGRVYTYVLLACIQPLMDRTRRPHQSGIRRSTVDAILAVHLLSEVHRSLTECSLSQHQSSLLFSQSTHCGKHCGT